MLGRLLRALGSLVVISLLVVGIPAALVMMVGNPWPAGGVTWSAPLTTEAVMGLAAAVGWVFWAQMTICLGVETVAALRAGMVGRVPVAWGAQQRLARALVHGVLVIGAGSSVVAPAATSYAAVDSHAASVPTHESSQERRLDGPHVTVRAGDSLWAIAEQRLGDGLRWKEIARLNDGRRMPDGTRFTDDATLQPGWQLRVPHSNAITVRSGDTLSGLAAAHLGDSGRWRELWQANRQRLGDPDDLPVGLELALPGSRTEASGDTGDTGAARRAPTDADTTVGEPEPPDRPARTQQPAGDPGRSGPAPGPSSVRPTPMAQDTEGTGSDTAVVDVVGPVAGVGAVLGLGLVSTLVLRRRRQGRHRAPGQRVPRPSFDVQRLEARLAETCDSGTVAWLDAALRHLGTHARLSDAPAHLRAVRLGAAGAEVYLERAVALPDPWEATGDDTVWLLPRSASVTAPPGPAPFPCLVTVGADLDGSTWLVDLGHLDSLGLVADDPAAARQVAAAMTVELATSPWGDGLQVTVVGGFAELPELLDSGRVAYQPTVGGLAERLRHRDGSATWPEVVVLLGDVDDEQRRALHTVAGGAADTTLVTTRGEAPGDWALRLSARERARLTPLDLDLSPARLEDGPFAHVMEALSVTAEPLVGEPTGLDEPRRRRDGQFAIDPPAPSEAPDLTEPSLRDDEPRLLLLGEARIDGVLGAPPAPQRQSTVVEVAAYVAHHPDCSVDDLRRTLWRQLPDDATAQDRLADLRRWLGARPDGSPHLPGGSSLRLDGVATDVHRFEALLPGGHDDASTPALAAAMALVRGRPFAGLTTRRYTWARDLRERLTEQICDAAVELSRRQYSVAALDAAEQTVEAGLQVEPALESLWRLRLQIDHARGDHASLERHVDELEQVTYDLGELAPETARLVDDLLGAA